MNILFRTDASINIGVGHVMRCLTLAHAFKALGAICHFACRNHQGNLQTEIEKHGYEVYILPQGELSSFDNGLRKSYAQWLGATQAQDAEQMIACIEKITLKRFDWIIVDHYGLDNNWHNKLRPYCDQIMVIDDLANRSYDCDVLLDQTFGRERDSYQALVPTGCTMLLGTEYALLRDEFSLWRNNSLVHRKQKKIENLLVTLGGVDKDNLTSQVLEAVSKSHLLDNCNITVIMGKTSPWITKIQQQISGMKHHCNVVINPDNIAELMAKSDLCIGAAGSTTWERCCLGLPTIQMVIAENQQLIANTLSSLKAITVVNKAEHIIDAIDKAQENLLKTSLTCSALCDGLGVERTISALSHKHNSHNISLIPLQTTDSDFLFSLQNKENRQYFRNPEIPSRSEHDAWFARKLDDNNSITYIIRDENDLGFVRIDDITGDKEISIIISNDHTGKGVAYKALIEIDRLFPSADLTAAVHTENTTSQKLFQKAGFQPISSTTKFTHYSKKTESYIVAAIGSWNKQLYQEFSSTLPGTWSFCSTPEQLHSLLVKTNPRYIFFPHWRWIVPETIYQRFECICFHMTDLPYGRGGSPLQNLISRGHKTTQLSALKMEKEVDSGPIYTKVHLDLSGKASEIYERASRLSWKIVEQMVRKHPAPVEQAGEPTHFIRRTPDQSLLPNNVDLEQLYDHIRMLDADGYPSAFITHDDIKIEFTNARVIDNEIKADVSIKKLN